jgi:prophage antirepressor-like protein
MKDTQNNERRETQLTPFTFENRAVRTAMDNGKPWFVAKDVCEAMGLDNHREAIANFPADEKGVISTDTLGGRQYLITVNEPGLYRLIFRSRKAEAEKFKTWVFNEVLPQIRSTGVYTAHGAAPWRAAGNVYSLFSDCLDMTIQRVNKLAYLLAVEPPLANADVARLLDVSDSTVTYWRKRLSAEAAREAVAELGIDARGHSANVPSRVQSLSLPRIAPEQPTEGANHESE